MMRQECGWFDKEEHAVGILSSYLSGDAACVQTVMEIIHPNGPYYSIQFIFLGIRFPIEYDPTSVLNDYIRNDYRNYNIG